MDEEQGLASPLAGGLRGIRRSVSSNVFSGRALPQQVSDPQQTSLLNQNSLTLTNVSSRLSGINERVNNINTSFIARTVSPGGNLIGVLNDKFILLLFTFHSFNFFL